MNLTPIITPEELQVFNFNGMTLRGMLVGSEPWFIAMDVAKFLEYKDAWSMTRRLDSDETQNLQIGGFGNRGAAVINESGLYSAILGSNKPEAKAFKKWVTSEVLPAIRKTGNYTTNQPAAPTGQELLALAVVEAQKLISEKDRQLEAQRPSVDYVQNCVLADDVITVKDWGLQHGISENQAREALAKYIYRKCIGERWSQKLQRKAKEYEWRPRRTPISDWFIVRAQHNAPRYTNGQARQTLYIQAIRSYELAVKVGVAQPVQQELRIA